MATRSARRRGSPARQSPTLSPLAAAILRSRDGSVVIEFAFIAPIFLLLILNVADFSRYAWIRMQVDNAAQTGAHAAYAACANAPQPARLYCGVNGVTLTDAVKNAIQMTGLGGDPNGVKLASDSPRENYYCVNTPPDLQLVGNHASPPSPFNCKATGSPGVTPGDYIEVSVSYAFKPIFSGISLIPPATVSGSSMIRLR